MNARKHYEDENITHRPEAVYWREALVVGVLVVSASIIQLLLLVWFPSVNLRVLLAIVLWVSVLIMALIVHIGYRSVLKKESYTLMNDALALRKEGSLFQTTTEELYPYEDIANVAKKQLFLDKHYNAGDIIITLKSSTQPVVLRHTENPSNALRSLQQRVTNKRVTYVAVAPEEK